MTTKRKKDNFRKKLKNMGTVVFDGPYSLKVEMNQEPDAAKQYFEAINNGWDALKAGSTLHVFFE